MLSRSEAAALGVSIAGVEFDTDIDEGSSSVPILNNNVNSNLSKKVNS